MREVVRYALIGPCLGACLGVAQTAVAAAVWVRHGQPNFYFRGRAAVELDLILRAVGGAAVGVPFGAVVDTIERLLSRRVRVAPAMVCAVVAAAVVTWAVVEWEFARRELLPAFALEGTTVAVAAVLVAGWSKPQTLNRTHGQPTRR